VNGAPLVAENGVYSFEMPTTNAAVVATIEAKPTYAVTIDSGIVNGTVGADKASAKVGETITLTVTAETGYETVGVTASGADVTKVDDTTYTFVMPAEAVTVTATFALEGLRTVDDFEGYTAGAALPVGGDNAFASVAAATAGTGARKGAAEYTVETDGSNVLQLYTKRGGAGGDSPSRVWLTTKDTFGNGTITLKIKVSGQMDYAGVKLADMGYELKISGGTATANGTSVASVSDDTWYTVEIVVNGTSATTTIKSADGATTLGTASATVSSASSAMEIGMSALAGNNANATKTGYTWVDDIQVVTG